MAKSITWNGKTLVTYKRPTTWQKWARFQIRRAIRVGGFIAVLAATIFGAYLYGTFDTSRTMTVTNTIQAVAITPLNVAKVKKDMIHDLAKLENYGGVPGYFDDNSRGSLPKKDKISYGVMAFKISTVQRFAKECQNLTLTNEQAVILALDEQKAKDLAECAIFQHGHIGEWSAATPEMFTKVKIINSL